MPASPDVLRLAVCHLRRVDFGSVKCEIFARPASHRDGTQRPGNLKTERYHQTASMSREQAIRIQPLSLMKTFHGWVAERHQQEGLLLSTDGRLKGMMPYLLMPSPMFRPATAWNSIRQKRRCCKSEIEQILANRSGAGPWPGRASGYDWLLFVMRGSG